MHPGNATALWHSVIAKGMLFFMAVWLPAIDAGEVAGCKALQLSEVSLSKVPPGSRSAALYMRITNRSEKTVNLLAITTPIAKHTMLHQTLVVEGVAKMQHVEKIELIPGQQVDLKPGGIHLMLMGLDRQRLKETQNNKTIQVKLLCNDEMGEDSRELPIK